MRALIVIAIIGFCLLGIVDFVRDVWWLIDLCLNHVTIN